MTVLGMSTPAGAGPALVAMQATAKETAERAGLTERTFFRHFANKREVLFPHANPLRESRVTALDAVPDTAAPIDAVAAALEGACGLFTERREQARQRRAVIDANTELQEREMIKLASLASALAEALRRRGVADPAATLAAEVGVAAFKVAFGRWISEPDHQDLARLVRESLEELRALPTKCPERLTPSRLVDLLHRPAVARSPVRLPAPPPTAR
ncbi:TetR family transcriptional regulator [Streptomyces sp. NPDC002054]|uniref:acyl-CoA-like ligand-binding transcription factor n=1 Tax=Streptomyces sp. NPDC002054 TaxID=3154663 RepID=UPI00331C20D3